MTERVLNEQTWPDEANAVIKDIKNNVREAALSTALKSTNQRIFINITTLEGEQYCVEMTGLGFKIVGHAYDTADLAAEESKRFETPYSLLQSISEGYARSFGDELLSKLAALQDRH